jgi:hypothetical protein
MADIVFSVQVITEKSQDFKTNSSASALEVIERISKQMTDLDGKPIDLSEYKVLVAYQLLSPERDLSELFKAKPQLSSSPSATFEDLKVQMGYHIFLVKQAVVSAKLQLRINDWLFRLERPEILIGRKDVAKGIDPDVDLSPHLGANELKVSRQLLILNESNGVWKIKLHPNAQTSVFLDSKKLQQNAVYDIQNDTAISIGNSPEQFYLKITTKLISE